MAKEIVKRGARAVKTGVTTAAKSVSTGGISKTLARPTMRRVTRLMTHAVSVGFQKKPLNIKGKDIPVEGLIAIPAIGGMIIPGANSFNRKIVSGDVLEGLGHSLITRGALAQMPVSRTEVHLDDDGRAASVETTTL